MHVKWSCWYLGAYAGGNRENEFHSNYLNIIALN